MATAEQKKWGCLSVKEHPWHITDGLSYRSSSPMHGSVSGYICPNVMLRGLRWLKTVMGALPVWMTHHHLPHDGTLWDQPAVLGSALVLAESEVNRCNDVRMKQMKNAKGGA